MPFVTSNPYRGYERDTESGNDYAVFRQYSNRLGRFMRADPLAGNILNPQSLNRFAYVLNNPGNLIDPLGLDTTCTTSPEGKTTCFTNVNEPGPNDGNRTLENVEAEVGRLPLCGSGGGDVCALILDFLNGNFGLGGSSGGGSAGNAANNGTNFFSSARLPGESVGQCVDRVQKALLGDTGQKILNALTPASFLTGLLTFSPGTTLASAGRVSSKVIATQIVNKPTLAGTLANAAVQEGTLSAETAAAVQTGSTVIGKVVAPVAAVATGLELGFIAACR